MLRRHSPQHKQCYRLLDHPAGTAQLYDVAPKTAVIVKGKLAVETQTTEDPLIPVGVAGDVQKLRGIFCPPLPLFVPATLPPGEV